ncbi:16S rRNA (cytosine(1402)-N(4))-methyltransferase RsmH [Helicobacter jaachi]|uniref:Ribosomal RNA small subunit methyltransferase H n=1 Tax=Helicobacter jaachi TaxID=1677920 RepID=A0A4U8TAM3_9HELI|nr:16S rRNA (cytosine(1402)-N(4))-methyltransferase RsmH [Helicobacter jaachi]TLD96763.1 16S rRNA (cytosine(1402)-N(4))-methyltransferase RsmH [Helicobacter jaachi]
MSKHYSVLHNEIKEHFSFEGGVVMDCTLGYGGHSLAILQACPNVRIHAFDRDEYALTLAKARLDSINGRVHIYHAPFSRALDTIPQDVLGEVKGIIADIGVSSMQLDESDRGFSFHANTLDMRMDKNSALSAKKVVNTYSPTRLEEIFRIYGEIRQSKKLAHIIVEQRSKKPFESCLELSSLIEQHFPRTGGLHPATLAFQALRIEVNDELRELAGLLESIESAFDRGALKGCKVGIIAFHSLEDRIIKHYFKQWTTSCICPKENYKCECGNNHARGQILTKKPLTPTPQEIAQNKRSRSAKLRIFELGAKYGR